MQNLKYQIISSNIFFFSNKYQNKTKRTVTRNYKNIELSTIQLQDKKTIKLIQQLVNINQSNFLFNRFLRLLLRQQLIKTQLRHSLSIGQNQLEILIQFWIDNKQFMQEQEYSSGEADSLRIQEQSEIQHMETWVSPQQSINRNNKLMQSIQKIKRNLTTSLLQPSSNMNHQHHPPLHSHQIQKLTQVNAILHHKLQISRLSHRQVKQANEQLKQSLRQVSQMLDEYNSEKGRKEEVEQTVGELLRGGEYRKGMRVVLGLRITLELDRLEFGEVMRKGDGEVRQKKQQQVQTQNIEHYQLRLALQNQLTQLQTHLSNKHQQLLTLQTSFTSTLTQHQLTTQTLKQQLQTSERRLSDYIKMNNEHTLELKKKMEQTELELKNAKRLNCRLEKVIAGKDREIGWLRMGKEGSRVSEEEEWEKVDSLKLIEDDQQPSNQSLLISKPTTSQSSTQSILPLYQHQSTQTIHSQLLPLIPPPIQEQIQQFQMIITHLTQQKDFKRGLYNFKTTFKPKRSQPPGTQILDSLVLTAVNFIKRVDEQIDAVIEKYEVLPQKGLESRIMKSTLVSDIRPVEDGQQEKLFAQKERQYEVEIQQLNKVVGQLNKKLVETQEKYQAQVMRLQGKLDQAQRQLTKLIQQKRDYTISMEELKRSFAKNADQITRLRQQRMQVQKKYDNKKQRIRVLQKNCQQLQGLTKSLREQIKQLKSRNEQLAKRKK